MYQRGRGVSMPSNKTATSCAHFATTPAPKNHSPTQPRQITKRTQFSDTSRNPRNAAVNSSASSLNPCATKQTQSNPLTRCQNPSHHSKSPLFPQSPLIFLTK